MIGLLIVLVATAAHAEAVLDIRTAIQKGLSYSPDLQKAQSEIREADGSYRFAESRIFPTINAEGITKTTRSPVTYDPATGASQTKTLYRESYTAQLTMVQPIYQGGALTAGISFANTERKIAQQMYFKAKQDYLLQLLNAYFSAAENDQKLTMAKENREILKGYFEVTKRYVSIGRSKSIDRLQAEANFALSEAEILRLETASETTVQDLLRLTGDTGIARAKINSHFDVLPVVLNSLEEAYQKASENNPDLQIARLKVQKQTHQNDLNLVKDRPSLSLSGAMGYISPDRPHLFDKTSQAYSVGFTLTIPLFSGLSSIAQKRINVEQVTQVEKDHQLTDLAVRQKLAVALTTLNRNFEQLKLTRLAAESARQAMDVALRGYRQGLITSTDVVTLQSTRYNSETQFLTAQFSYLRQVLNLRHDLGIDLEKVYDQ